MEVFWIERQEVRERSPELPGYAQDDCPARLFSQPTEPSFNDGLKRELLARALRASRMNDPLGKGSQLQ
jgi:hypothetical protein